MELGLFSPCSNVEKLPSSPFLGHARTERLLETDPKPLAPRQEGLSSRKTLFPGCFEGRRSPDPTQDVGSGVAPSPLSVRPSIHPSIHPCFPISQRGTGAEPMPAGLLYPSVVTFSFALCRRFPVFCGIG